MKSKNARTSEKRKLDWIYVVWFALSFLVILFFSLEELFNDNFDLKWPWRKRPEPVAKIQEKIYTPDEFVIHAGRIADSLKITESTKIVLQENESVEGTSENFLIIEPFKMEWTYEELLPVLKEFPLTVKPLFESGTNLLVPYYKRGYTEFVRDYGPGDTFEVRPGPKYLIKRFDNKVYLIGQQGKLWNRRY